jgi:hypothetical protein
MAWQEGAGAAAAAASSARSRYLTRSRELAELAVQGDDAFLRDLDAIQAQLARVDNKHTKIRVKLWVDKLSEATSNATWKKNRDAYARLLLAQLEESELSEPFIKLPDNGPLPTLPLYLRSHPPRSPTFGCTSPRRRQPEGFGAGESTTPPPPSRLPAPASRLPSSYSAPRVSAAPALAPAPSSRRPTASSFVREEEEAAERARHESLLVARLEGAHAGQMAALQTRLESALRDLESQRHMVETLKSDLATERHLRVSDKQRLRTHHLEEIDQLQRLHLAELDSARAGPPTSFAGAASSPRSRRSRGSQASLVIDLPAARLEHRDYYDGFGGGGGGRGDDDSASQGRDVRSADAARAGSHALGGHSLGNFDYYDDGSGLALGQSVGLGLADGLSELADPDDDRFLDYLDEFQRRAKRMIRESPPMVKTSPERSAKK